MARRVDVELFNSTTVGSEIVYQCQSGLLPEGGVTSVCREDGRWNPDPATLLCEGKMYHIGLAGITRLTSSKDNISLQSFWLDIYTSFIMQQTVEFQDHLGMELF